MATIHPHLVKVYRPTQRNGRAWRVRWMVDGRRWEKTRSSYEDAAKLEHDLRIAAYGGTYFDKNSGLPESWLLGSTKDDVSEQPETSLAEHARSWLDEHRQDKSDRTVDGYVRSFASALWYFLDVFSNDVERMYGFQELIGAALVGDLSSPHKPAISAHGSGSNGKSVSLDAIREVFGGYASTMRPKALTDEGHVQSRESEQEAAAMTNVRLAVVEDSERPISGEALKALTESVRRVRPNYQDPMSIHQRFTVALQTNRAVKFEGHTDRAAIRRILVVPFEATFGGAANHARPDQRGVLLKARDQLGAWLVRGAFEYIKNGRRFIHAAVFVEPTISQLAGSIDEIELTATLLQRAAVKTAEWDQSKGSLGNHLGALSWSEISQVYKEINHEAPVSSILAQSLRNLGWTKHTGRFPVRRHPDAIEVDMTPQTGNLWIPPSEPPLAQSTLYITLCRQRMAAAGNAHNLDGNPKPLTSFRPPAALASPLSLQFNASEFIESLTARCELGRQVLLSHIRTNRRLVLEQVSPDLGELWTDLRLLAPFTPPEGATRLVDLVGPLTATLGEFKGASYEPLSAAHRDALKLVHAAVAKEISYAAAKDEVGILLSSSTDDKEREGLLALTAELSERAGKAVADKLPLPERAGTTESVRSLLRKSDNPLEAQVRLDEG